MATSPAPETPRPRCMRCLRPVVTCFCASLTSIETRTRVVILQHPRERHMPIGTARMASLCLPGSRLHVGVRWDESAELRDAMSDPARPPILLWPGEGAKDVLREPPTGPVTLIVIDGTWSQAKSVVRDNPVLRSIPRYAFEAPAPTIYRIRREPRAEYVSTIEALMHVLGALEGEPERFRALLRPMEAMIDAHLAAQEGARRARVRHSRAKVPPCRRIPDEVLGDPSRIVCVSGEADAWHRAARGTLEGEALVHWVAVRLTGEVFDEAASPPRPLAASTPQHSGLDETTIRAGRPCADVVAAFASWLRPDDVVLTWGDYAIALFEASGGVIPPHRIDVRSVARRISHGRGLTEGPVRSLEEYAERIAPEAGDAGAPPIGVPRGRAGRRARLLASVARRWRAIAEPAAE